MKILLIIVTFLENMNFTHEGLIAFGCVSQFFNKENPKFTYYLPIYPTLFEIG